MSEDRHKETLTKPTATETLETQVMSKHSEASDQNFDSLLKEALTIAEEYAGSDKSPEPEKTVEDSTPEEIQGHVGNEKTKDTKEYVEEKVFTGTNKNVSVEAEAGEEVYKLRRNIHVVKDDTSKDKVHSNDYESLQVPGMTKGKMNRRVTHEKINCKDNSEGKMDGVGHSKGRTSHPLLAGVPFNASILFVLIVIYFEVLFHINRFGADDGYLLNIILFAIIVGCVCSVFVQLFSPKVNYIIAIVITSVLTVFYLAHLIYNSVFNNYLSIVGTIQYGNQAADNAATVAENIGGNWIMVLLFLVPLLVVVLLSRKICDYRRNHIAETVVLVLGIVALHFITVLALVLQNDGLYNPYQVYKEFTSVDMAVEELGACESFVLDVREVFRRNGDNGGSVSFVKTGELPTAVAGDDQTFGDGSGDDIGAGAQSTGNGYSGSLAETVTEEAVTVDVSPNVMDIDLAAIGEDSGNDTIASMCDYFNSLPPTNKNKYTGMFEGFNLIWITCEGFSGYLLEEEEYFPTISYMAENGFVFENYYQPLWYGSTLGGEYANLLGMMPNNGGYLNMTYAGSHGNDLYFSIANQLNRQGYTSIGYHDNSYDYYDRDISHPVLGYDWRANGSGLEAQKLESGTTPWPQSDLIMVQDTFDEYKDETPFNVYYLTVSGHLVYTFDGNYMAYKNKALVEELDCSETMKAYIASEYETELAFSELIKDLKAAGLYENTVIVLAGDHVPYDCMDVLSELAGKNLTDNFEEYRSKLIIFSGAMETPVKVDKVCSSIDILATVSNLMGLDYDSRLLIGQDILSDSPGIVYFPNRSYITDNYIYNSSTNEVTVKSGAVPSDDELENMNAYVANKFTAAKGICENDFWRYVDEYYSQK